MTSFESAAVSDSIPRGALQTDGCTLLSTIRCRPVEKTWCLRRAGDTPRSTVSKTRSFGG